MACPLRFQCILSRGRKGRRVLIHPQEALLQQARALQQSAGYDEYRRRRVVGEHRLARLVHLGIRQSRYFGRVKTKFQLYLAAPAAVAVSAAHCAQGPSVPLMTSSPRGSVKSRPWPCLRRPHCRNSSHSSPRTRISGQIPSLPSPPDERWRWPASSGAECGASPSATPGRRPPRPGTWPCWWRRSDGSGCRGTPFRGEPRRRSWWPGVY